MFDKMLSDVKANSTETSLKINLGIQNINGVLNELVTYNIKTTDEMETNNLDNPADNYYDDSYFGLIEDFLFFIKRSKGEIIFNSTMAHKYGFIFLEDKDIVKWQRLKARILFKKSSFQISHE